ncbi:cysteine dioxygenase type I [Westerdykella ornata]|uniref:Cysteine dioxygenase n=1 Tax=Westerdykella ornata TaxID=318751 RepID=A0A6A6JGY8_WESOR|nr:cysteine dioxygenase type I [Westerdykella ornata]KAF2275821.1 cysteine dioxygenase type I [Westerdykella ornata]
MTFDHLVNALRNRLGEHHGISDEEVDTEELKSLMRDYISQESEWAQYAFKSATKHYTRNLVDKGNGKSNLLILVWTPGKGSPVHDHANAHCIMKVLKGRLVETRYMWPTVHLNNGERRPLQIEKETIYNENEVTYMSDKLGLHKIRNPDEKEYAVSLHLYTPPNAAVYGCNTFDEQTGRPSHQKTCPLYSEYGRRTKTLC